VALELMELRIIELQVQFTLFGYL